jgi:hypothetical protein
MKRGKSLFMVAVLFIIMIMLPLHLKSQTYIEVHTAQAPALIANAGADISIDAGQSLTLGGTPAATGGTGSLTYYWSPSYYIDQLIVPNPLATPAGNVTYTLIVADERGCYATDEIVVTVIGGSGIAGHNADGNFVIYPNPSSGAFTIEIPDNRADDIQISVMTVTGQVVYNEILTGAGITKKTCIDLSSLPKGSYILIISSDLSEIFRHIILN